MKEITFRHIAIITLAVGVVLLGVVAYNEIRLRSKSPIAGTPDMIKRNLAIEEAKKKGETTYGFETSQMPGPIAGEGLKK